MTTGPRVRFAPSPTGFLHVGGACMAQFNWIFARGRNGTFILRIEDTDAERNREEWVNGILDALRWLGLDWDEGPYRQSQRTHLYAEAAEKLLAARRAYWCDCTRESIEARTAGNTTPGYDRYCRTRGLGPGPGRALRFAVPLDGETVVHDVVRGTPSFQNATVEDFVLVRSNGAPVFILANVVDDVDMRITHVIRGEEHLPNTPKALLLWSALAPEQPPPVFAHLPLLVNERRQKLSKRRDPVALEGYRDAGYLPEAMRNYLMLLGWAPADGREIVSTDEAIAEFRLEDLGNSPAFFDTKKLDHVNATYIRALPVAEFAARAHPWLEQQKGFDADVFARIAPAVQERVRTLGEVPGMVDFLFTDEIAIDADSWERAVIALGPTATVVLDGALAAYADCAWEPEALHRITGEIADAAGLKLNRAHGPIRVAVTGRSVGPPLFESLAVLGRDRTLARLRAARARL